MITDCDIVIPWGIDGNLGAAYNRSMQKINDWVIFQDHDVIQLNPFWYHMVLDVIAALGHTAGLITGTTNLIACPMQFCPDAPKSLDLVEHMQFSKDMFQKFGNQPYMVVAENMPLAFSGFFMVTHKEAWEKVGGFKDGFLGVDNAYHHAVLNSGYKTYVIPGLYMFHLYYHKTRWEKM